MAPTPDEGKSSKAKVLADYFTDLAGDKAGERVYAARYLKGELQRHAWTYEHAEPGSLADLDARSALTELGARIPDACEAALLFADSAVLCAEMLAKLEHTPLLPQVRTAAAAARNKAEAKRFVAAISQLEAAGQPPPPPSAETSP